MAMTFDTNFLHVLVDRKLARIASYAPEPPAWYEALKALGPKPSDQERLTLYQSIFHGRDLSPTTGFFLVARQVEIMCLKAEPDALGELSDQIQAIRRAHGMEEEEDEDWLPEEAPEEYRRLQQQFEATAYEIQAQKLDEIGEHWMADVLRTKPDMFDGFYATGRRHLEIPRAEGGPEVDEERLKAVLRNEVPDEAARETLRLVHTYASWNEAYMRLMIEEAKEVRRIRRRPQSPR